MAYSNNYIAFYALRNAIFLDLWLSNFIAPFTLETDFFGVGIGPIVSQSNLLIAFYYKKLSTSMQKQSTYARELYAISEAVAKFWHYLLGHKFIIKMDQKSIQNLMD